MSEWIETEGGLAWLRFTSEIGVEIIIPVTQVQSMESTGRGTYIRLLNGTSYAVRDTINEIWSGLPI